MHSNWPLRDIWEARQVPRGTIDIDLVNRPQHLLIYRQGFQVQCHLIDAPQETLLEGLLAGRSLGEVLEEAPGSVEEISALIPVWFSDWLEKGLIHRVVSSPESHGA